MDEEEGESLIQSDLGSPPSDRYYLVYWIFCLLGLGSLLPWNFFITAEQYFKYKFRNVSLSENEKDPSKQTELQTIFESSIAAASMIPNLLFNFVTAALTKRISVKARINGSLFTIMIMFIFTLSLVNINTDAWQVGLFVVTLATVVVLSAASSVLSASMLGLAGMFPSRCMQAAISGQAIGGIFAAVANIITLVAASRVQSSATAFFTAAVVTCVVTIGAFMSLYMLEYSKFYLNTSSSVLVYSQSIAEGESNVTNGEIHNIHNSYMHLVLSRIWKEGIVTLLSFFVTLSCFPALANAIKSVSKDDTLWTGKLFTAVVCFLLFNVGDWVGRFVAGFIKRPKASQPRILLLLSIIRLVYIPLILLCNIQPRSNLPVVFNSDVYPVVLLLTLGLTNGYVCTLALMYGPKKVVASNSEFAGTALSVFVSLGLASGSLMSLLLVKVV